MIGWYLFKSKEAFDQFLSADESAGLEMLTKEDLTKMLERIEEAK